MIDIAKIEASIVNGLQAFLNKGREERPCTVLAANQTAPIPPYPYVSYTIITIATEQGGTFSIAKDGTRYRTIKQKWSFTIQSDSDTESQMLALSAVDWFNLIGRAYSYDNEITVERVTGISNRDNLLSIEYEYRNGFDVTFGIISTISEEDALRAGVIETTNITKEVY